MTDSNAVHARLFTALVGSRAHGMETPESDVDLRYVMVVPTAQLVSLTYEDKHVRKRGGYRDENFWELRRFIELALKADGNTLEALRAPLVASTPEGDELRALFPKFLSKPRIRGAFLGFAENQRRRMFSDSVKKNTKAGVHYLRTLYNGLELLNTGDMTVRIGDTPFGETLMRVKRGEVSVEEVLRLGSELESNYDAAAASSKLPAEPDLAAIDEFYVRVRKAHW